MENRAKKMSEFVNLVERHAAQNGLLPTSIDNLTIARTTQPSQRTPDIYTPAIGIGAQGQKDIYLGGKRYDYKAGSFLTLFVPMVLGCEVKFASPNNPFLAIIIGIDLKRITKMILDMDQFERTPIKPDNMNTSGIFSAPIKDNMLDASIRLLRTLDNPSAAAILGKSIIDEIYFHILNEEQGGSLKYLLQQRGQIRQISKAVEYLHQNLDKPVSVDDLAGIVNMSTSGFHKKFKQVMHLSPLQYAKSIKLNHAQTFIIDGKSVTEASYMVGYNNLAQFSREYKRHFGFLPSAT